MRREKLAVVDDGNKPWSRAVAVEWYTFTLYAEIRAVAMMFAETSVQSYARYEKVKERVQNK